MLDKYLDMAASDAKIGVENGDGGPFGAVIIDKFGNVLAKAHNMVLKTHDPTNHAEIVAIRQACKKNNTHDLSDCTIFSSCEPCPMCLSAIIWANIKEVYFGATKYDATKAGFNDELIYEYLENKNNLLEKHQLNNKNCQNILINYKGVKY